jgi:hypothetical protein
MKPPEEAPTMPKTGVTMRRSGSGTVHLANTPAMAPMATQLTNPMCSLPRVDPHRAPRRSRAHVDAHSLASPN